MRVPFQDELDETFRSDRSVWIKIGGCSLVTIFVVVGSTVREVNQGSLDLALTTPLVVGLTLVSSLIGAIVGLMLSLKDTIDQRIDRGDSLNPILRLFFGQGKLSLFAWFVAILIAGFVVTIVGIFLKLI